MNRYVNRKITFFIFLIAVAAVFSIRLFNIQVISEEYKQYAESNVLQKQVVYPLRGLIYDRNMKRLVANEVVYDLLVIPGQVKNPDTLQMMDLLGISREDFEERLRKARKHSRYRPSVFMKQISLDTYGQIQERLFEFPGFTVRTRTSRNYPFGSAPHVLGYLGEVDQPEIDRHEGYYRPGEYIGKSGLELEYEEELRGTKGMRHVMVDVFNREQGSFRQGEIDLPPNRGYDLVTTLDLDLQKYGEQLMQNKKGAIVAIEPATGEILSLISSPSYDPNQMQGHRRATNYGKLMMDKDKPLYNRAVTGVYPPGSTFKTIMGLIAEQEGIITPSSTYTCYGAYHLGRLRVGCHRHSPTLDLAQSIQHSCNAYYCHYFRMMIDNKKYGSSTNGYNVWRESVTRFGVGVKLGIDIPNESQGILYMQDRYDRIYGKGRWKASTIISLAIGQAEISLTPLQMANMTAVIANRGYYIQPHLMKAVEKNGDFFSKEWPRHESGVERQHFDPIVEGMQNAVTAGTATRARLDSIAICGKTGTSENPHGEDHSLFIGFAPKENPEIIIVVVVENAGFGGTWAAPIASLMLEKYLTGEISEQRLPVEKRILEADFITPKKENGQGPHANRAN